MAIANSASKLLPSQRVPFTPLSTDVFVVENFNVVQSPNDSIPAYGTPHDDISKLKSWPNHKFCNQTQADEQGNYQRWYVADQAFQQTYNYEISDSGQWKSISQTFVIPRASYVALPLSQLATPALWAPSTVYAVGVYVTRVFEDAPSKFYRCTVAHTSGLTFDPTKWTQVPSAVDATYPAPPNPPIDTTGYAITSTQEQKIGEPKLDSLYVAVQVVREKVTDTQTQYSVDLDTNTVRAAVSQKVPAGTLSTVVDPSGSYKSVDPSNSLWSTSTTRKAAGLAGSASNGVATRTLYYRDNYSWPRVLNYINIQAINSDPRDIFSPISAYSWFPVWLADAFDGPCDYTLVERWTLAKPVFNGDSGWNTGTVWAPSTVYALNAYVTLVGGDTPVYYKCTVAHTSGATFNSAFWNAVSPLIPSETPMLKTEIVFEGTALRIRIPACLHTNLFIRDTQFYAEYPSTNPPRWPATVLARVTVAPDQGGYLTRMFYVNSPSPAGVATNIDLTQTAGTARGFTLSGTVSAKTVTGTLKLSISTDPNFGSGFLGDYNSKTIGTHTQNLAVNAPPTLTTTVITGATPGVAYYAKLVCEPVNPLLSQTSRLCIAFTDPQPELSVLNQGQVIISDSAPSSLTTAPDIVGGTLVGVQSTLALTLASVGLETLAGFSAKKEPYFEGDTTFNDFTLGDLPVSLTPSSSNPWNIFFTPTSAGLKRAKITITTNAATTYILKVQGTGAAPEIQVEQPLGTILIDGSSTINYGTVTTGSASDKVFYIRNVGTDNLRRLTADITQSNPSFSIVAPGLSTTTLAPAGITSFTVRFAPEDNSAISNTRTAVLTIGSSDENEDPFTVNLTGESQNPTAPGAVDPDWNANTNGVVFGIAHQSDGKAIIVGNFTTVGGVARNRIARVDSSGVVDATFNPDANGLVLCVLVQPDGKIIIGGNFTSVGGSTRNRIARLNSVGVIDATFNPNSNGAVRCLGLRSDGEIMVGGDFTNIGGGDKLYLAQLNIDGSLDAGFVSQVETVTNPGRVNGIQMLQDGDMFIVGDWYDVSNTTPPPTTAPPTTAPPTTAPPTTPPPTTAPPTTAPPTTAPPTTAPPTTAPPTTAPPTTPPPSTTPPP
jgi:hypothetical protein